MGLLDAVLGAAGAMMGGQQNAQQGGLAALLPVVVNMLGNNGTQGGLGGLVSQFDQAGLGHVIGSWIGSGQNLPISSDQIGQVLGSGAVGQIAQQLGIDPQQASGMLAQVLPSVIDHLTPHGQAPAGGLGNAGDLMGMLGGLLQKS